MIAGCVVLPTTPLLVPGVTTAGPDGLARVTAATRAAVAGLPPHDVAILLTPTAPGVHRRPTGTASGPGVHTTPMATAADHGVHSPSTATPPGPGVHTTPMATLAGIGRPDLAIQVPTDPGLAARLTTATGLPLTDTTPLPLAAAVLAHLLVGVAGAAAVVAVGVPSDAAAADLVALGEAVAGSLDGVRAVVVAAGDLSAGLTEEAPLALVEGARDWDERVVDAVASGRLDGLARLGPEEAARVGALGWAPLVALHGVTRRARVGLVVRTYAAPRGVGYLVAAGA